MVNTKTRLVQLVALICGLIETSEGYLTGEGDQSLGCEFECYTQSHPVLPGHDAVLHPGSRKMELKSTL